MVAGAMTDGMISAKILIERRKRVLIPISLSLLSMFFHPS